MRGNREQVFREVFRIGHVNTLLDGGGGKPNSDYLEEQEDAEEVDSSDVSSFEG